MRNCARFALSIGAIALFAGCAALRQAQGDIPASSNLGAIPQRVSAISCPCLYVTNANDSVTVYALSATGNAKPIQNIRGSKTGLSHPHDVAVDESGSIYVANASPASVTVYAAGATGNVKPIQVISGSHTKLGLPTGIAVDSANGDIYVSNISGGRSHKGSVTFYAPGSNGDVAPLGVIQGSKTRLDHPNCLALDASENIAVTDAHGDVAFYAAGSTGNVAPTRTIAGTLTKLKDPTQVMIGSSLNAFVANAESNSLTVYAAGAKGNVAPIRDIHGSRTKLSNPLGVAVDGAGNIYAAGGENNQSAISVYGAGSNGNVRPIETITGDNTDLEFPQGIAIH